MSEQVPSGTFSKVIASFRLHNECWLRVSAVCHISENNITYLGR
jgi:hypothetical protein